MVEEQYSNQDYEPDRDPVVFKTIGAPGTGKTTRVVGNPEIPEAGPSLVQENLNSGYEFEDIFICTYTKAGTEEAADRLARILDVPKYKIKDRVRTIHSACFNLLDMDREQVVTHWDKRDFCDKYDLEFGWDDDEDDIMGADKAEGNALFDLYGWLQNNCMSIEQWKECPQEWTGQDDPIYLMEAWEQHKAENDLMDFSDMIHDVCNLAQRQVQNLGWGVLFPDDDTEHEDDFKSARHDPERDPDIIRGKGAFLDTKVMFVDEVQDLYPLQWRWYLAQKLVCDKVYIGGDDDQCLPPNAPVEVKDSPLFNPTGGNEEYQKPVKDVKVGDLVRTMESDGEYSYKRVTNVTTREVTNKRFRTIKTESGHMTAVTDNHKMFARVPAAEYETESDKHYVYLMRDNYGYWRIGETDNLRQRQNVERGARCMVPLAAFDSKEEALIKEAQWSLNYSIPQITIEQRDGEVMSDTFNRELLYSSINPQYDEIEHDLGVYLDKPPLFKKATTRGRTESLNINIKMCADMRGNNPQHQLIVSTSDEDTISYTEKQYDMGATSDTERSTRFRKSSTDITELGEIASQIQQEVGGDIITYMSPTEERSRALVTPAGNLVEGMLVPVARDGEVVWEEIIEIEDNKHSTEVYDLTVSGTHNFTSGGIGVHNTIYGWSGADPDFMLGEEGDFEVLDRTYRIPENIWNTCDGVIRQVDHRQEKDVEPDGDGGEVIKMRQPSAKQVLEHAQEGSVFILCRARYMIDEFTDKLHKEGIPYDNMSTFETWDKDVIRLRDAMVALRDHDRGEASRMSGDAMQAMLDYAEDWMLTDADPFDPTERAFGNFSGVEIDRVKEMFDMSRTGRGNKELRWQDFLEACKEGEDLNYYQMKAIMGNVKKGNEHMDHERVKIGTIHSSKGKEAQTVILALDTTQTIAENMREDTRENPEKQISDPERRVYYVGMTRASEKLVLVEGLVDPEMTLRLDNLLGDEQGEGEWKTSMQSQGTRWS